MLYAIEISFNEVKCAVYNRVYTYLPYFKPLCLSSSNLCLDFTTIRRGYMKSNEESSGKPEDGEQLIRYIKEKRLKAL